MALLRFGRVCRRRLRSTQLLLWRQLQRYGYVLIALGVVLAVLGIRQMGALQAL